MEFLSNSKVKKVLKVGIVAGALFTIPTAASAQYIVKPGDSLGKIAQQHGMSLSDILSLNKHFDNPNMIHIGDHVVIRTPNIGADVVSYARSLDDKTTYVYGGQEIENPPLFTDCSGWVQHIYSKFGIKLPRTSRAQSRVGIPVKFQNMQEGDLMFFSTRKDRIITHVGIYMGNDYWISNLSTKQDVEILSTWGSWTQRNFLWAQRVI